MEKNIRKTEAEITLHDKNTITVSDNNNGEGLNAILAVKDKRIIKLKKDDEEIYIPFHAVDHVVAQQTLSRAKYEDGFCPVAYITGIEDITIEKCSSFSLTNGVKAYDANGNEILFTVTPDSIDTCKTGKQEFVYEFGGYKETRVVTIVSNITVDANIGVSVDLFGKVVSELQENIAIGDDNSITGKLFYVSDYTGFSSDPDQQKGHYLAIHVESVPGATITVTVTKPSVLDSDGIIVLFIVDSSQTITITANKDGEDIATQVFTLSDLILEEE